MRTLLLFLALLSIGLAQDAQAVYSPMGIPCDPSGPNPFGQGFPFVCPPEEEQGILVFLRTDSSSARGYRTSVKYTTASGEEKEAVQVVAKRDSGVWTVDVFKIGRLQTVSLGGIKIVSVTAQPVDSLDAAREAIAASKAAAAKPRD